MTDVYVAGVGITCFGKLLDRSVKELTRVAVEAALEGQHMPAATPARIVDQLNEELAKVMQIPELKDRLTRDGALVLDRSTPEQFAAHMREEKVKWARVVKVSGAKAQ